MYMYTYEQYCTYGKQLLQTIQCSETTLIILTPCCPIECMSNTCPG